MMSIYVKEPSLSLSSTPPSNKKPKGLGVRHCQAVMTFFCLALAYAMRAGLSIAIVAMTSDTGYNQDFPIMPWSLSQQGVILSSFFWGYIILQVPLGHMSRKYGPKYILLGAILFDSLITLASPLIILNLDWRFFLASRILNGLVQGGLLPCCNTHISKWAPLLERSRMFAFVFGGSQFGAMVTLLVAGFLAASPWGWPSIFYVTGLCGLLWSVLWAYLGADSPDSHPRISAEERAYIKASLVNNSDDSKRLANPWKDIVTSLPVWAVLVALLSRQWGYWTLLTMMPNYMSHILHFDIKNNGLLSSLPYFVLLILTWIVSWIDDYIVAKRLAPIRVTRKAWTTLALWGSAAALVGVSSINSATGAVALFAVAVGMYSGIYSGALCNHLDLAPNFAGVLMGISGVSNITSTLGPLLTGFIVQDSSNKDQWMVAFYIAAGVLFVGNSFFIVFGSTELQPWNSPKEKSPKYIFSESK